MMIYASALDANMGKEKRVPMPSMSFGKEGSFTIWPRDADAQEICFFENTRISDRSREEGRGLVPIRKG